MISDVWRSDPNSPIRHHRIPSRSHVNGSRVDAFPLAIMALPSPHHLCRQDQLILFSPKSALRQRVEMNNREY